MTDIQPIMDIQPEPQGPVCKCKWIQSKFVNGVGQPFMRFHRPDCPKHNPELVVLPDPVPETKASKP